MVISMHHIYEFLRFFTVCNGVKSEAMHQVFKKSPEKTSPEKSEKDRGVGEFQLEMSEINKIKNNWQIYTPDHQRMSLGEHFHIAVSEKLRLPLVVNFLKLHNRCLSGKNSLKTIKNQINGRL